jgi:hypothetical protein
VIALIALIAEAIVAFLRSKAFAHQSNFLFRLTV